MTDLTAERLRQVLHYDPDTGVFRCKPRPGRLAGRIAGAINHAGYRVISVDRRQYRAARLAFLYVYGRWPVHFADHINRNRDDDRIANLRECSATQNHGNQGPLKRNGLGIRGIRRRRCGWEASLGAKTGRVHIGTFRTAEAAQFAYAAAARAYFGSFFSDQL